MATRLEAAYDALREEAVQLAGGLGDLVQRATVYRHLYRFSGGNHLFPLIAAHGALWAGGYLRFGRRVARLLSWQYGLNRSKRNEQLECLTAFENALREINRSVCVDTYVNLHFTDRYGTGKEVRTFLPESLLEAMNCVHTARQAGRELSDHEKRLVFTAHFHYEQEHVVGPTVTKAFSEFNWPLVRAFAYRPPIRFAYFPGRTTLRFHNFSDRDERISKGLQAFELGAQAGWSQVEASLEQYEMLSRPFFTQPEADFLRMRAAILAGT